MELQEQEIASKIELQIPLLLIKSKESFSKGDKGYHTFEVVNTHMNSLCFKGSKVLVESNYVNELIIDGVMYDRLYLVNETTVKGSVC
jgi:hypothetical protein